MDNLKRNNIKRKNDYQPNKKMTEAAIAKGKAIGLSREELIDMASRLDKNLSQGDVAKLVDQTKKQDLPPIA